MNRARKNSKTTPSSSSSNNNSTTSTSNITNTGTTSHRIMTTGPSEALIQLIAPDGYYTYLGIPKPSPADIAAAAENVSSSFIRKDDATGSTTGDVDEDMVKKSYRKLSLKHHPDKPGGDAETFRVLNRAQKVLINPKLRKQYDILGLDLDDDDDDANLTLHPGGTGSAGTDGDDKDEETTSQGIVHEIATMVMAAIMHLGVRTAMTCVVSTIVVQYRITMAPAILFLAFLAYNHFKATRLPDGHPAKTSLATLINPFLMILGLICMYFGRTYTTTVDAAAAAAIDGSSSATTTSQWTWRFWLGESLLIGMFTYNSVSVSLPDGPPLYGAISIFATIMALWFRGRFWNYVTIMAFELALILFVVMAFPVMEMVLETILNEKLRKVGDKVRAHQKLLEAYYAHKEFINK